MCLVFWVRVGVRVRVRVRVGLFVVDSFLFFIYFAIEILLTVFFC